MDCIASSGKGVSLLDTHKHEMTSVKVLDIRASAVFCHYGDGEKSVLSFQGGRENDFSIAGSAKKYLIVAGVTIRQQQ